MPAAALILFYLLIALAPLALAAGSGRPPRPVMDEIASGMAMVAFAILLMEFVLSGRFRSISGRVGLDVTMRFHQLLARTALVLALAHPFLYTLPFAAEGLATGVLAFVLLPGFVILSIARDRIGWRYETWRLAHGLGALAIAVLVLIHARHAGRYSADPQLAGLWAVLTAAAVLSLAHVYLVKPLLARRHPWEVTGLRQLAERTWEVVLSPRGHEGISYRAGQFAWIRIGAPVFSLRENPFSIASAPGEGKDLRFVIKELGDFTATLSGIPLGTRAYVDGPHGNLVLEGRQGSGIAFIAGGVGIAPMLSLLRQLEIDGDPRPTVLVYGNRHAGQIACTEDLARMRRQHRTEVVQVLSEPPDGWEGERGMVDAALIARLFTEARHRDWLYVLCGPAPMMEGVEEALLDLGVAPRQIISERFQHD